MALANREEAVTLLSGIGLLNKREKQRETAFHSDRAFTNKVEEVTAGRREQHHLSFSGDLLFLPSSPFSGDP